MLPQDAVATVTHSELSNVDFIKVFEEIANHKEKQNNLAVFLNPDEKYLSKNNSLTYEELNNYANQLAHYFIKHVEKGATIALFMEQSAAAIITILAALKAGYPFMPLNPDPNDISVTRLESFIENTNTRFIVSHSCHKDHLFLLTDIASKLPRLFFDKDVAHFSHNSKQNPEEVINLDSPAYIINSSGSTGVPKKIRIKRRGLYSCMRGIDNVFHFKQDDQIVLFAKLVFDASILDIMMPLANGAQAHIPPTLIRKDPVELKNFLKNQNVSIAVLPPAMLRQLNPDDFHKLRAVISTGEKIDVQTLKKWSHILIVDGYGPAEVTIATWLRKIFFKSNSNGEEKLAYEMNVIPGLEYFILTPPDEEGVVDLDKLKEMPDGESGEIYITGVGLGEYVDSKLSAERFPIINHPRIKGKKIRVFQTHDLAIRDVKGNVEIIGRTDRQRKIDGELYCPEEIEAALRAADDNIAIAYVDIDETNRNIIRGYIELKDKSKQVYLPGLYEKIVQTLSLKMVPEQWVILDKIPLNSSFKLGKGDLLKLRELPGEYIQSFNKEAPIDDLEKVIAQHLFTILKINIPNFKIYRDDNILYLGLKSLQCAMFLRELRNEFRQCNFRMTLPELMEAPTIASIARVVRRLQKAPGYLSDNIIVPFNTVANPHKVTPIILCPSLMGDPVEDYGKLKEMWPHQRQLYLLMNRGKDCLNDIDNYPLLIARDDAKVIVNQFPDPEKPLFIAGWSLGGLRGLLLMNALEKIYGRKNVRLLMIDTEAATVRQLKSPAEFAAHLFTFCEENLQRILGISLAEVGIDKSELAKLPNEYQVYYFFDKLAQTIKGSHSDVKKYSLEIIKNNFLYLLRYVVPNKISNITLIAAKKTQSDLENHSLNYTSSEKPQRKQEHIRLLHASLLHFDDIISVEGNHKSILLSDSVKQTADLINQFCIKQDIAVNSEKIREKLRSPIDIDEDELINYVPAMGSLDITDKDDFDLADSFTQIIRERKAKSILLLGEAAVGKSTFIQFLTLDLLKKYSDLSVVYIKLSRYQDPAEDLIDKHLKRLGLTKDEVQYVKAHIPLVIFIDDYEEIDKQQFKNLIATNKLSELNAMVVFCVRSTYLLLKYTGTNYRSLFYPITKGKVDKESFKEMYVRPFKPEQTLSYIKKYLENCTDFDELPKEWQTPDLYIHYLKIIPNASDLCSSPFFLNRYLKHIRRIVKKYEGKQLHEFEELTEKALLDLVTQDFYEREFDKMAAAGMSLDLDYPTEMEAFSISLAYDMYKRGIYKVTYKEAVRFIAPEHKEFQAYFGLSDKSVIRIREGCLIRQVPAENPNDGYDFEFDNPRLRDYYAAKKFGEYRSLQQPLEHSPDKQPQAKQVPTSGLAVTTLFVTQPPAPAQSTGVKFNPIKSEPSVSTVNPIRLTPPSTISPSVDTVSEANLGLNEEEAVALAIAMNNDDPSNKTNYALMEDELKKLNSAALVDSTATTQQLLLYVHKVTANKPQVLVCGYVWNLNPHQKNEIYMEDNFFPLADFIKQYLLNTEIKYFLCPLLLNQSHFAGLIISKEFKDQTLIKLEIQYINPTGGATASSGEDEEALNKIKQAFIMMRNLINLLIKQPEGSEYVNNEHKEIGNYDQHIIQSLKKLFTSELNEQQIILKVISDKQQINGCDCAYIVGQTLIDLVDENKGKVASIKRFNQDDRINSIKAIAKARASFCDPNLVGDIKAYEIIRDQLIERLAKAMSTYREHSIVLRNALIKLEPISGLQPEILFVAQILAQKITTGSLKDELGILTIDKAINFLHSHDVLKKKSNEQLREFCDELLEAIVPQQGDVIFKLKNKWHAVVVKNASKSLSADHSMLKNIDDENTPDCSGKKLILSDGRIITIQSIYKAAADGNCSFRAILEHHYLGQQSALNRKDVIDTLLRHLMNPKIITLIANDIRAKYQEWICNVWAMDADKDFPRDLKEKFRDFKAKFEKMTNKDYQEGVSRQFDSYCEDISTVKAYLEKYLIKDEIFPHLHGCISAFAQIYATKIYCIQVQSNGELKLIDLSRLDNETIYKKEIFLLQNKELNHFDYLRVSIAPAERPQNISVAEYNSHGLLKPSATVTSVRSEDKSVEEKPDGIKLN